MKINDILNRLDMIAEAPAAQPVTKTGTGASGFPTQNAGAGRGFVNPGQGGQAKTNDPKVMARQKELIAAGAKIKADGIAGPATTKAEADFGAIANSAKGGQANPNQAAVDASNAANAAAVAKQKEIEAGPNSSTVAGQAGVPAATDAASLKAAQDKAAGNTPAAAPAAPEPAASTTPPAPADDLARMTQLAGAGRPAGGYGNFTGGVPQDQAAQSAPAAPAAEPAAAPAKDPTVAPVVKTGTGGTLTTRDGKPVTSRSDDEIAWASKQPMGGTGQQYPGAGNWDPRTGRDLKAAAQGEKNWNAIKNFFGGNKQPAAAPAAPAAVPPNQSGQTAPAKGPATPGGYGQFSESEELTAMLKIAGLR